MLIYAHRGSSGRLPENTLAALRGAIADGAEGAEFDVHATADGVPVLLHDRDLASTTTGVGPIDRLAAADLAAIDAGNGERVPTLADALAVADGRLRCYVEVKQPGIEAAVLAELRRHSRLDWFVASFDREILRAFRRLDPRAPLWPIAESFDRALPALVDELGSPGVSLEWRVFDEASASRLAGLGLACAVWTVNDPAAAVRARDLGAAILVTDHPATIRRSLDDPAGL